MKPVKVILIIFAIAALSLLGYNYYPESKIPEGVTIDKIVVIKSKREMQVFAQGKVVKTYNIAIGKNPVGRKEYEGDHKTPEGNYMIYARKPNSAYHKNLGISYPNTDDIATAKTLGKPPGGDIKIHGMNNKMWYVGRIHRWTDWTNGCIALTNDEIDDLYEHTPVGTVITILP